MKRTDARLVLILSLSFLTGCVLVSSRTENPPARDAGHDAAPPMDAVTPFDAPAVDASARPILSRDEATRGLLASVGRNVVLPTLEELAAGAAILESATAAHSSAGTTESLAAAREAWTQLMAIVERAELLQFGPAAMAVPEILGGRGLRDRIYTYPTNRCLVNVIAERRTYGDLGALAAEPAFARGLGAIEYQLFEESTAHGCDPGATTRVDDVAWAALGDAGIRARRAEAAHADAQLVRQAADELLLAWSPSGGNFSRDLADAGSGGSVYPSTQAALNAMFWAMYYTDRAIKDMKLGVPTGINELCGADACPELLESRWGGRSSEHLAANLAGLEALFLGGPSEDPDRVGFDDLLRAIDQGALADDIVAALSTAVAQSAALPTVDATSFATHEAALEAMHATVLWLAMVLKVDFAGVLAFTPPPGAGEDND